MVRLYPPVTVKVGLCGSRDLYYLNDFIDFLDEWPAARRGPHRDRVRKCCVAALATEKSEAEARRMFIAYARLLGVLQSTKEFMPAKEDGTARHPS
jgi:hypothetical protein